MSTGFSVLFLCNNIIYSWMEVVGTLRGVNFLTNKRQMLYSYRQVRVRKESSHSFDPHCWFSLPCLCLHLITPTLSPPFLPRLDAPRPPAEDRFILPDEFAAPVAEEMSRAKRSPINSNRVGGLNVETLVVADRKMLEKHGRENVTTYVLTVMNMVRLGTEEGKKTEVTNEMLYI